MLTPDEMRILAYLRQRTIATIDSLSRWCGSPPELMQRLLRQMEWFNYLVVYHDADGTPLSVQITEAGAQMAKSG